jgi:predicted transcriptional regulator of viral defense system
MPNKPNKISRYSDRLLRLIKKQGTIRAADAASQGIPWVYVRRLARKGRIQQVSRGVYRAVDDPPSPHHGLVLVALRSPHAVVSLLSALAFHELTTQLPPDVWITIGHKAHPPKLDWPHLRVTRATGTALTEGVQTHELEGVSVRVYSPAKTVVDCFKFRSRVGLDVALEALREYRRQKAGTMDELERFARICRVSRVMRPYLEALAS